MIYILTDPGYAGSVWCRNFLQSLTYQFRKNRMTFAEVFDSVPSDAEAVFIIASEYVWTRSTIKRLNSVGIYPILISNNTETISGCVYSSVSPDIYGSLKRLLAHIGDRSMAIYGINPQSLTDTSKVDFILSYYEENEKKPHLFYFDGSFRKCYESFISSKEKIEVIICTNDFAAVSLVRNLKETNPELLDRITIYSMAGGVLSHYYSPHIKSIDIDYSTFGRAAIHLYKLIQKHSYISTVSAKVSWENREIPDSAEPIQIEPRINVGNFIQDEEVVEMMSVEKLLNFMDETDRKIMQGLRLGRTICELADDCYLSQNGVKYRIKKLLSVANVADKNTLTGLLKKYIDDSEEL